MKEEILIKDVSPFDEDVSILIDILDHYQESLYPPESNHLDSRDTLSLPNCKLIGAYKKDKLCGIGAVKLFDDYGELKRMYVIEGERGGSIAETIILNLEAHLQEKERFFARLETGVSQIAAIKFYKKMGYVEIPPFGDYKLDELSLFMEKKLHCSAR